MRGAVVAQLPCTHTLRLQEVLQQGSRGGVRSGCCHQHSTACEGIHMAESTRAQGT